MMELKSWSQQNDNNEEDTQVNTLFCVWVMKYNMDFHTKSINL